MRGVRAEPMGSYEKYNYFKMQLSTKPVKNATKSKTINLGENKLFTGPRVETRS